MSLTPIKGSSENMLAINTTNATNTTNINIPPNPTVLVDIWENQRYKAIGGGWKTPFQVQSGVPHYSNAAGGVTCGTDYLINSRKDVHLESGWSWCGSDWQWDRSGYYGSHDEDGWSYSNNFEELFKSTLLRKLSGKKHPVTSLVRRRRLIRKRTCKWNSAEGSLFSTQGRWLELVEGSLQNVMRLQNIDVNSITSYEINRVSSYSIAVPLLDKKWSHIIATLGSYRSKLAQLKQFLVDKGKIEQNYSTALWNLSSKWISAGITDLQPNPSPNTNTNPNTNPKNSNSPNKSDNTETLRSNTPSNTSNTSGTTSTTSTSSTSTSTTPGYTANPPGFFKVLSVAHEEVSDRLGMFANRILLDLVQGKCVYV